jgi:hypothetical protein
MRSMSKRVNEEVFAKKNNNNRNNNVQVKRENSKEKIKILSHIKLYNVPHGFKLTKIKFTHNTSQSLAGSKSEKTKNIRSYEKKINFQ